MSNLTGGQRWAVHYTDGDGSDDWQLLRNTWIKYFPTEAEAKEFAKKYMFPKKPIYWQPTVWLEVEYTVTSWNWKRADSYQTNLDFNHSSGGKNGED